ncbi:radical SAM domain-containing protein [Candidatus Magnetomorum sp. HK-1]|nr:radical SAM domain-containing protein [Candidatus Magnetomorum sp. HK-1]
MKILFIVNIVSYSEPMGVMQLSSILKKHGHDCFLAVIENKDVLKKIEIVKPDIIAFSIMSVDVNKMIAINQIIRKKYNIFTIVGGAHPTFDHSFINTPGVDAICVGEGDEAIVEVVNRIENNNSVDGIKNIITKTYNNLKLRDLYQDLDNLPYIDRKLAYEHTELSKIPLRSIYTSRGCPFNCTYCFNNKYKVAFKGHGSYRRRRSVDSIIEELVNLIAQYKTEFIRISDDVFLLKTDQWLEDFSQKWKKYMNLPFYCLLRPELIDYEMISLLKNAGCNSVHLAIESGNDIIRNKVMKRKVTKQQIIKAHELCHKFNIRTLTPGIIGMPLTKMEHEFETIDLMIKCKPSLPGFSIFMPFPGTSLGNYCVENNLLINSQDWYGTSDTSNLNCFDTKQILAQKNLRDLGPIAVKFSFFKNLILKYLIRINSRGLFSIIGFLSSMYLFDKHIIQIKKTKNDYFSFIKKLKKFYSQSKKTAKEYSKDENIIIPEKQLKKDLNDLVSNINNY